MLNLLSYASLFIGSLLTPTDSHCTSNIVDDNGNVGAKLATTMRDDGSISGIYYDFSNGDQTIWFFRCANEECSNNNITDLEITPGNQEAGTAIAYQSDGLPFLAFQSRLPGLGLNILYTAKCNDDYCNTKTLSTGGSVFGGCYVSMAMRDDDTAIFTNFNLLNVVGRQLQVISCLNTACTSKSLITVDSTTGTGMYASLKLNSLKNPVIAYGCPGGVCLARCAVADCDSANNTLTTIANTAGLGTDNGLLLDSNNIPTISTYGRKGTEYGLYVIKCDDQDCTTATVSDRVGGPSEGVESSFIFNSNTNLPVLLYKGFTTIQEYDPEEEEIVDVEAPITEMEECNDDACTTTNSTEVDGTPYTGGFVNLHQSPVTDKYIAIYQNQAENNRSVVLTLCPS